MAAKATYCAEAFGICYMSMCGFLLFFVDFEKVVVVNIIDKYITSKKRHFFCKNGCLFFD